MRNKVISIMFSLTAISSSGSTTRGGECLFLVPFGFVGDNGAKKSNDSNVSNASLYCPQIMSAFIFKHATSCRVSNGMCVALPSISVASVIADFTNKSFCTKLSPPFMGVLLKARLASVRYVTSEIIFKRFACSSSTRASSFSFSEAFELETIVV